MNWLIVLIGAGQNVNDTSGQFMPEYQPDNTIIHVVDQLYQKKTDSDEQIRSILRNLNPNNKFYENTFDEYLNIRPRPYEGFDKIIFVSYTIEFNTYPSVVTNSLLLNFGHYNQSIDLNNLIPIFNADPEKFNYFQTVALNLSNLLVRADNLIKSADRQNTSKFNPSQYFWLFDKVMSIVTNKLVIKTENQLFNDIFSLIIDQLHFTNIFIHECINLISRKEILLSDLVVNHESKTVELRNSDDKTLNENLTRYFKLLSILVENDPIIYLIEPTLIMLGSKKFYIFQIEGQSHPQKSSQDRLQPSKSRSQSGGSIYKNITRFNSLNKYKYLKYKAKYLTLLNTINQY